MTTPASRGPDALVAWAAQQRKVRPRRFAARVAGLRFAFYGRISTSDYQDRASSRHWQRYCADELVADRGHVVVEFFDEGVSRRVPWPDRPQAGALLAALADPARGFDAVVVGEYERAFQGEQLHQLAPILRRHAVELWLPEVYGPVDFDNPRHLAVVDLLGRSAREIAVPGSGPRQRCGHRFRCRGATWAGDHPTVTCWWMPVRTPTVHTPRGGGVCTGSSPIRPRRRTSVGCSPSGSLDVALPALLANSTTTT
jgi:hypothetical protein